MSTTRRVRVTKRTTLEIAHALRDHDGLCRHIHGHSYVLDVSVTGDLLDRAGDPKAGMVIDFSELKTLVQRQVVDHYDHALVLHAADRGAINTDHPLFARTRFTSWPPTCENLLLDMVARINAHMPRNARLSHVRLQETATSWAEWDASGSTTTTPHDRES
ncbi:MAG: 6-carboxytetrahydropterin synthase [Bacteroidetes bacterium]|jgi:6-pyruvoyltetrahydropterin/6-carboxytetrahydropterin synthase|nr:6-carboxytetrahydropterin synthase [Bacteroidota bacterium]MBX7130152.1 6-carboxytetrahydropterin synthase [Flavobacteriales bacterium]HMU14808.1 6-carboxytetrahydropterin synthase [Flavobacteriales bacterium]HMW96603.1 6-carboxytetrahydropterin synthase [Flavobacteriales bacterium]HMZ48094.1 6-carboxytetrahydropterin synthase [Flavobacteriales bacterium]